MRCLGVDPGSTVVVWGIVEPREGGLSYVGSGEFPAASMASELPAIVREFNPTGGAVERPIGFTSQDFNPGPVISTAWFGGRALGMLEALGVPGVELMMREWRAAIALGRTSPGDAVVKAAIQDILGRTLPARTNNHVRDALGVATVGRVRLVGGAIRLTNSGALEVDRLWREQQTRNTTKGQRTRRARGSGGRRRFQS